MAWTPGQAHDTIKFGEDFELDLRAYQLRQAGRVVKLEPTPMELLLFLIEHSGELITRDQIVEKIWGKDVFLDTDNSINGAIRKIRQVLRDNPEQPRFLQTVTGKGYRFIAPIVEPVGREPQEQVTGSARYAMAVEAGARTRLRKGRVVGVTAAAAVLALALSGYLYLHRTPKLTDKDTIVLADFTNTTGDPVFDETLRRGMVVQLEQSPFLSLISEERIQQVLQMMGQPPDVRLTPEIAREICERTGSAAVLDGSITRLGSQYVLGLRARDCRSGGLLDDEQVQAARKEDVLNALSQIASKFRARVGESLATLEKHNTPLAEATTSSLEALKAFSTAQKVLSSAGSSAALPRFQRATEIDPKFAIAFAWLGRIYGDIGESALSAESTSKAYELRDRASDAERFFITASYDLQVTGNVEKAQQTCEAWIATYPRAVIPYAFLSGMIHPSFGNYERSAQEAKEAIELDPDFAIGYLTLSYSYLYLDRLEEADDVLRRAAVRKLEISDYLVPRYDIAFLRGDREGMEREVTLARQVAGTGDWISNHEAFVFAYSGRLHEARKMSSQARDEALQASQRERAALYETGAAVREALFGNTAEARQRVIAALQLSNERDVEYGAAFAFGLSRDSARSQAMTDDLERRLPEDTSVRFSYIPTLRALLALNNGKPSRAIELLQAAEPSELGIPGSTFFGFFGALYPVYVRGEAYLAKGRGAEAAAEFQKILDHRGIVVSDPIGALAHLQLGRAYALSGDKTRSKSAYQDFLTLWKDADPDIPILKQARAEYANLN
jgi:eukaryotic-like serine/threonine-protein kinase